MFIGWIYVEFIHKNYQPRIMISFSQVSTLSPPLSPHTYPMTDTSHYVTKHMDQKYKLKHTKRRKDRYSSLIVRKDAVLITVNTFIYFVQTETHTYTHWYFENLLLGLNKFVNKLPVCFDVQSSPLFIDCIDIDYIFSSWWKHLLKHICVWWNLNIVSYLIIIL